MNGGPRLPPGIVSRGEPRASPYSARLPVSQSPARDFREPVVEETRHWDLPAEAHLREAYARIQADPLVLKHHPSMVSLVIRLLDPVAIDHQTPMMASLQKMFSSCWAHFENSPQGAARPPAPPRPATSH